ncbi:UDP-N-acetylmuramoyl-L-alanine--D-glutamate ligase [Pontibacillus salipaludis]|uniref:UDP-N-acetylmuramoylalanine--D-glutamate ligase n=1 Tax=Pontibacillus salipaludis TaxID=1697394 RepID=A0ABQ1Q8G5_9BACI|nr:UDP-N-acetylmuramoyl-L-alanine--D-glutamate ligase [Pontibacillus salipaludis]GGD19040.1 UDP-N-acetylmuramoylalanine--D-glutamate ligase [Pontibacillus salipaludis]
MNKLTSFPYNQVLVLGLAKSGEAAAKLLNSSGVSVRVNDQKPFSENPQAQSLYNEGIEVVTGGHPLSVLDGIDYVVKNPGIPYTNPIIETAVERGVPVVTEIELAYMLHEGQIVAITGSNGKTTTTTLVYEMLSNSKKPVALAGNIGKVSCEVAQKTSPEETMVMELSSFQLLGTETFKPDVSVFLNLYEAHLDYHKTMEHYGQSKAKIFANQTSQDYAVYNADHQEVCKLVQQTKAQTIPFSLISKQPDGIWTDGTSIYYKDAFIIKQNEILLEGDHNLENTMAAIAASLLAGATVEGIREVLTTFTGVEHRLQYVKDVKGRRFFNDSKATNILAAQKALNAFSEPTIWLAGGLDRGQSFEELDPSMEHVKAMVVFGETGEKLRDFGTKNGIETILMVDNVKQAAEEAYRISAEQDVILLSPACASWDQYKTFEERGNMFVRAVHTLE